MSGLEQTLEKYVSPMPKYCATIHIKLATLTLTCELKTGRLVTPALLNLHTNFDLTCNFLWGWVDR